MMNRAMKWSGKIIAVTLFVAIVDAALSFKVPIPHSWNQSHALFYGLLALSVALAWLHIGAVVLFATTLGAYKQKMQRAFVLICVGIALLALSTLQVPIISALNLWSSGYVVDGGIGVPFVMAGIAAYFGVRNLAILVGAKSWLARVRVALPVLLAICWLTSLLPHVHSTTAEFDYDLSVGVLAWSALAYSTAAGILAGIRRHIGAHYTKAMAWLLTGFTAASLALLLAMLATLFSNKNQDGWSVAIDSAGVISGLLFLKAAQVFVKAGEF